MLHYERKAHLAGFRLIAGIDEAGRGPLAGPVVASAVLLKDTSFIERLDDSKRLSPTRRQRAYNEIIQKAIIGMGIVDEEVIDRTNILSAALKAMEDAVYNLVHNLAYTLFEDCPESALSNQIYPLRNFVTPLSPSDISNGVYFLIDGNIPPNIPYPYRIIVRGDTKSLSIAAASIISKVTRDRIMLSYHKRYPQYGFVRNKGYYTKEHIRALRKYGPSPIHRRSFRPIKLRALDRSLKRNRAF